MKALAFIPIALLSASAFASEDPKWANNITMNGVRFGQYADFARKWKLVTVRYRTDSGEFRFIYANPLAWKALQAGGKHYPDGAIFAKTGYLLSADPVFTSSLVPSRVVRYQFMVRDTRNKNNADTDGWSYAAFNPAGRTFPGKPHDVAQACNACHRLVADRGSIFAQPVKLKNDALFSDPGLPAQPRLTFETVKASVLPPPALKLVPEDTRTVRSLQGEMRKYSFQGTLDEIRPFLAVEALKSGQPAVLLSEDAKSFSLVFRAKPGTVVCDAGNPKAVPMVAARSAPMPDLPAGMAYAPASQAQPGHVESFCLNSE